MHLLQLRLRAVMLCWAITPRSRFSLRVYGRGLPRRARILRALSCNGNWSHAMRWNAGRFGWAVRYRAIDRAWIGHTHNLGRFRSHHLRERRAAVLGDSQGAVWSPHARRRHWFGPEAVQDCFLESSIVSLRNNCRTVVRTDHDWRHDLGRSLISKRSAAFLSQRSTHRLNGSARLGFWMSAAGMAFRPHRKAKAGDHRERDGHDFGWPPARAQTHPNSGARRDVPIRRRIGRGDDSLQRHQRSESRQCERQRDWRDQFPGLCDYRIPWPGLCRAYWKRHRKLDEPALAFSEGRIFLDRLLCGRDRGEFLPPRDGTSSAGAGAIEIAAN